MYLNTYLTKIFISDQETHFEKVEEENDEAITYLMNKLAKKIIDETMEIIGDEIHLTREST